MSIDTTKPYEQKNIIERHTTVNGDKQQFNIASALVEIDVRLKLLEDTFLGLDEALGFFTEWYNTHKRVDILVPTSNIMGTSDNNPPKLIL